MNSNSRWFSWISGLVLFLSITSVIKVVVNGSAELDSARAFLSEGNLPRASEHFERAVGWYLPGWDLQREAALGMQTIASVYEKNGERQKALDTYRMLRGAIYATRSFFTPHQELIRACNEKIATLMAQSPPTRPADRSRTFEQRREANLKILTRERSPHSGWAVAAEIGFFGWVGAAVSLIIFGFTPTGDWRPRPALLCILAFLTFYAAWLTGLMWV